MNHEAFLPQSEVELDGNDECYEQIWGMSEFQSGVTQRDGPPGLFDERERRREYMRQYRAKVRFGYDHI